MRLSARHRLLTSSTLIVCLLFQQVALAAFACAKQAAPPPVATMSHCAEMDMPPEEAQSPALCEKHCAPDLSFAADTATVSVPALGLPPVAFPLVLAVESPQSLAQREVPITRSDPPPRLRYCSLQI
jgi:hypothetical protein